MKYEMIFGYADSFDQQNNDMAEVMLWHDFLGPNFVNIKELSRMNSEGAIPHGSVVLAMRRIIADPKRWTVEDKKAGRLPEVGCECLHCKSKSVKSVIAVTATHIVINANNSVGVAPRFLLHDEFMQYYMPIETPEEKAARLREEWCSDALGSASILSGMKEYELKRLGGYVGNIYDALLSGDLPVPSAPERNK